MREKLKVVFGKSTILWISCVIAIIMDFLLIFHAYSNGEKFRGGLLIACVVFIGMLVVFYYKLNKDSVRWGLSLFIFAQVIYQYYMFGVSADSKYLPFHIGYTIKMVLLVLLYLSHAFMNARHGNGGRIAFNNVIFALLGLFCIYEIIISLTAVGKDIYALFGVAEGVATWTMSLFAVCVECKNGAYDTIADIEKKGGNIYRD